LADGYLARPVPVDASPIPQNPSMSPNPWSAIHNDTYMSDTYPSSGALGSRPVVSPTWLAGSRLACSVPVFQPGKSATENSLVATDKSIVVENNYGYADWSSTMNGQTTTPGITRIDIDANGTCQEAWTNESISIPSLVTKMSLANA
jgi:hypothetical protein